jgi:hypothetical protein
VIVGKRSAGERDSARAMARSTASGIVVRRRLTEGTGSTNRLAITDCALAPMNGGSPASSS